MTVALMLAEKGHETISTTPDSTIREVVDTLAKRRIGAIVVIDAKGDLCGIISERDVVRELSRAGASLLDQPVSSCMTKKVITCQESNTVDEVMTVMTENRFRHIPVTSGKKLVGLISIGDVVKRKIAQAVRDAEELRNYIATG